MSIFSNDTKKYEKPIFGFNYNSSNIFSPSDNNAKFTFSLNKDNEQKKEQRK